MSPLSAFALLTFARLTFGSADFVFATGFFLADFLTDAFFLELPFFAAGFRFAVIPLTAVLFDFVRPGFFGFFLVAIRAVYHQRLFFCEGTPLPHFAATDRGSTFALLGQHPLKLVLLHVRL